jgi:hypothetical protein
MNIVWYSDATLSLGVGRLGHVAVIDFDPAFELLYISWVRTYRADPSAQVCVLYYLEQRW